MRLRLLFDVVVVVSVVVFCCLSVVEFSLVFVVCI